MSLRSRMLGCSAALFLTAGLTGCMPTAFLVTPVPASQAVQQRELRRTSPLASDKIAVIDLDGMLIDEPLPGLLRNGENPVAFFVEKLNAAEDDKRIKGVVLRINSPGGTVTASEMIHCELERFREHTGKPVVTVMTDVAASGAYYSACATDYIVAYPSTITGSIGVIMQMFNVTGTMRKIGVTADAIKSGPNKDAGSPFSEMSPAQREIFQKLVNEFYDQFVAIVVAGRPELNEARVRELADGRVYSGPEALKNGLVDQVGTIYDGIDQVKSRAGLKEYRLVTFQRPVGWKPNVYADAPAPATAPQVNLINVQIPESILATATPKFLYLWAP